MQRSGEEWRGVERSGEGWRGVERERFSRTDGKGISFSLESQHTFPLVVTMTNASPSNMRR